MLERIHSNARPIQSELLLGIGRSGEQIAETLVEVWFGIIERQAIHRGTFGNVRELTTAIKKFIAGWNGRAHPFVSTKTADQILKKANRQPTSNTDR